jgi:hypothetical protein
VGIMPELQLSDIERKILFRDSGCSARHAGCVKKEGRKAGLPARRAIAAVIHHQAATVPMSRSDAKGSCAPANVDCLPHECCKAIAFNDGDRHRASGGLTASPKNERGLYFPLSRIPDEL